MAIAIVGDAGVRYNSLDLSLSLYVYFSIHIHIHLSIAELLMDWMWFMILLGEVWLVTKVRHPKALVLKSELSHSYLLLNNWLDNLMWLSHYPDDACTLLSLAFLCYTSDYFMLDSAFLCYTIRRLSSHAGRLWFKLMVLLFFFDESWYVIEFLCFLLSWNSIFFMIEKF